MEGNGCYKFSTIQHFVNRTGAAPIKRIVDVGANIGEISLMMHAYFPSAQIISFEPVREYWEIATRRTAHIPEIRIYHAAVTYQHVYTDDLGLSQRSSQTGLRLLKALPCAGPGWLGGSCVYAEDDESLRKPDPPFGYELLQVPVEAVTLESILHLTGFREIDLLKMDCEGCESPVLGCASLTTLQRIRFIAGEYHGIDRFYNVMRHKLFRTHKVNLVGDRYLGAFFAERLDGNSDGILRFDKSGMLVPRPWLSKSLLDWHLFNEKYVLTEERAFHGLLG